MMNNEKQGNGLFWLGFFIGGLVGAFLLYLLATKKGRKLTDAFVEQAEEYEEKLEEKLEDKLANLEKQGEALLEQAHSVKDSMIEEVETKKQEITGVVADRIDATLSKIEDIQRKGVALTEEVHHRVFRRDGKPLVS